MNEWFEAEQRVERAQQLSESHCFAEALAELEVALSIHPNNALWHAQRGYLLEELDRMSEAVEAYERSLELEPGDQDVSLALGSALTSLGRYTRALEVLEELAHLCPDLEPTYCGRIQVYAELGRHEQAEEMFYLAQELDDACPHCFYHMGGSLFSRGCIDRAIYCWQRVLDIEPTYMGVNRRIAQAYRAKSELGTARDYLLRELREDPGNTDILFELGELALESGQPGAAAAKFEQIVELDPQHAPAHMALGAVLLQMNNAEAALTCLETAASVAEPDDDLNGLDAKSGEALVRLGRYEEALARLESALESSPDDFHLLRLLGDVHVGLNHPALAADCYRRALEIDADDATTHHKLALVLFSSGRTEDALKHDLHALRSRTNYVEAMYTAALAMATLGHWRKARAVLDQAERLDPDNEKIATLRGSIWRIRLRRTFQAMLHPVGFFARAK